jgi:hypothetical protein
LYALSTLNVVPANAERVANEPVPDAGDTADERRVLKATPRTAFEAVVPVVRSSTVLNRPVLERDQLKFNGGVPNAERT